MRSLPHLLIEVEHNTADDVALLHALVGPTKTNTISLRPTHTHREREHALLERRKRLDDIRALHLAPRRNIQRLARVLAVPNIRAKDTDALDDGEEDIRARIYDQ